MLLDALEKNGWVKFHAARHLNTTYRIFNYKYAQYGLDDQRKARKRDQVKPVASGGSSSECGTE